MWESQVCQSSVKNNGALLEAMCVGLIKRSSHDLLIEGCC